VAVKLLNLCCKVKDFRVYAECDQGHFVLSFEINSYAITAAGAQSVFFNTIKAK